jgi:hypothetical protein
VRILQDAPPTGQGPGATAAPANPANVELPPLLERVAASLPDGRPSWIAGLIDPYIYLDEAGAITKNRGALLSALSAARLPGIARIFDVAALPAECPPVSDESEAALVCRAVLPGVGGAFYATTLPGIFFDPLYARGFGMSHGSPEIHDRAVPLLVRAPRRVRPVFVEEPLLFATFTRTAASLLGMPAPAAALPAPDLTKPYH